MAANTFENMWWVAIPILAFLLFVALIVTAICLCCKKCRNKKDEDEEEDSEDGSEGSEDVESLDDVPQEQFENTVEDSSPPAPPITETAAIPDPEPSKRDIYEESDGLYSSLSQVNGQAEGAGAVNPSVPPAPPPPPPPAPPGPTRPADVESGDAVYSVVDPVEKERARTLKAKREAASRKSRTDNDELAKGGRVSRDASHVVNITLD